MFFLSAATNIACSCDWCNYLCAKQKWWLWSWGNNQKENMDSTTNYIVHQIEQLIFVGHFYEAEHLTNISKVIMRLVSKSFRPPTHRLSSLLLHDPNTILIAKCVFNQICYNFLLWLDISNLLSSKNFSHENNHYWWWLRWFLSWFWSSRGATSPPLKLLYRYRGRLWPLKPLLLSCFCYHHHGN